MNKIYYDPDDSFDRWMIKNNKGLFIRSSIHDENFLNKMYIAGKSIKVEYIKRSKLILTYV